MIPYINDYEIPDNIPGYSVISVGEKTDWNAIIYVSSGAVVNINSQVYYQNGEYVNGDKTGDVEIVEK